MNTLKKKQFNLQNIKNKSSKPCNLARYDWSLDTNNICIDLKNCSYQKQTSTKHIGDVCFNMKKGHRSYLYVRETLKNIVVQESPMKIKEKRLSKKKECSADKILNPVTNRCVYKHGAIGKRLLKERELL